MLRGFLLPEKTDLFVIGPAIGPVVLTLVSPVLQCEVIPNC